jgi:hypothetical protein
MRSVTVRRCLLVAKSPLNLSGNLRAPGSDPHNHVETLNCVISWIWCAQGPRGRRETCHSIGSLAGDETGLLPHWNIQCLAVKDTNEQRSRLSRRKRSRMLNSCCWFRWACLGSCLGVSDFDRDFPVQHLQRPPQAAPYHPVRSSLSCALQRNTGSGVAQVCG